MPRGAAPCRAVFGVVWLLISIVAPGTSVGIEIADYEFSGRIGIDGRWYPESALYPGQRSHASGFVLEPEFYIEDVEGRSFTLAPFFRYDAADPRRTHVDLREAYLLLFGGIGDNEWELRLGVDQVFWGVVESQRLVDIINQVDFVEHPDGTAKLGQPMAHATLSGDWGVLELFGLPYHRARTFSGRRGRLRLPLVIDDDNIRYESAAEEWHLDFAARYSNSFGPLDMGLSVFDGTSREPSAQLDFTPAGELNLVQYYTQIRQFGLDAQLILGPWLFKLEAIQRSGALNLRGREEDYMASVIGSEYTLYSVFDSVADLTLFGEWHWLRKGIASHLPDHLAFQGRLGEGEGGIVGGEVEVLSPVLPADVDAVAPAFSGFPPGGVAGGKGADEAALGIQHEDRSGAPVVGHVEPGLRVQGHPVRGASVPVSLGKVPAAPLVVALVEVLALADPRPPGPRLVGGSQDQGSRPGRQDAPQGAAQEGSAVD